MATKKQYLLPVAVLVGGIGAAVAFSAMKTPPEEKPKEEVYPLVKAETLTMTTQALNVASYGEVKAKDHTQLVAQVSGQVVMVSDKFVQGGFVKDGEVLARIDPNDYEAALTEAEANLAQARSALEIERAQAHVAQAEWERISKNSHEMIPSELYLRKPQLAEKLARYRAAEASVKRAKRNLERTYIKAPYDAIINAREISLGSVVNPGSNFGSLSATNIAEVRLPVADTELQYLVNGGIGAEVTLSADVAGQQTSWQGKIVRSEGVIDKRSRMTYLVAQIDKPYADAAKPLRFGAYINATINGKVIDQALSIPRHLVKDGRVAVINKDNTLSFKTLDIIRESNGIVIAESQLEAGEQLITSALEYPSEGMKLRLPEASQPEAMTQLALKED